ncbi:hypothetical protein BY458DRAFT_517337 [Sporodiniella umbellata]|nr:hypothetical protein BY458DRAFT_528758 [Sporodiniella umbellata]KAI9259281.1 hypothetical protein BY458DRAFT_517337 [Sporodiniella umbellata]
MLKLTTMILRDDFLYLVLNLVEELNTTAILDELKLKLCEKFEGLKISISAVHKHLIHEQKITLEKLEKNYQQLQNSDRVIVLRKAIVEQ